MKIDIHVHSKHSKRPSQWILKKIGCPESFTEPLQIYRIAKNHGMSHVTITDHNSISGALEIAHLSDTFISEEITTYFPDDGCKIHVLALNITETQHAEIQRLRTDIFDLVQYLKQESILNIVAHPLYAINDRLRLAHFEQLLLCFRHFELNGARNQRENQCLRNVLSGLVEADINRLADKHDRQRLYPRGIDTEEFNPSYRNGLLEKWFNIRGGFNLLYVGRVSKEKNIHLIGHAFKNARPNSIGRVPGHCR